MKVSILGVGWLGLPLAIKLLKNGFIVHGSTTTYEKLEQLKSHHITPFLINLDKEIIDLKNFLDDSKILIVSIPPKVKKSNNNNNSFLTGLKKLIFSVEASNIEKVLFISSISVYPNTGIIDEDTIPLPENESGKQILEAENLFLSNRKFKTTIIRFGGLISSERHPVFHLSGKTELENPDAPVNLIHLNDCIGIILKIIEKDIWNEIFNAVCDFHPSRKEYYTQKVIEKNLIIPQFNQKNSVEGKIVYSKKLCPILNYTFQMKI